MAEFDADRHVQEVLNEVAKGVIKSYLRGNGPERLTAIPKLGAKDRTRL